MGFFQGGSLLSPSGLRATTAARTPIVRVGYRTRHRATPRVRCRPGSGSGSGSGSGRINATSERSVAVTSSSNSGFQPKIVGISPARHPNPDYFRLSPKPLDAGGLPGGAPEVAGRTSVAPGDVFDWSVARRRAFSCRVSSRGGRRASRAPTRQDIDRKRIARNRRDWPAACHPSARGRPAGSALAEGIAHDSVARARERREGRAGARRRGGRGAAFSRWGDGGGAGLVSSGGCARRLSAPRALPDPPGPRRRARRSSSARGIRAPTPTPCGRPCAASGAAPIFPAATEPAARLWRPPHVRIRAGFSGARRGGSPARARPVRGRGRRWPPLRLGALR